MWTFRRKPPTPPPELTNDGFRRWLRAHRPPLQWFLGLSEIEQETLAGIGDEYAARAALDIGYAVRDPELAEAGMAAMAGDPSGEAVLAQRVAQAMASKLAQAAQPATAKPADSFAGLGSRRQSVILEKPERTRTFLGRSPDPKP